MTIKGKETGLYIYVKPDGSLATTVSICNILHSGTYTDQNLYLIVTVPTLYHHGFGYETKCTKNNLEHFQFDILHKQCIFSIIVIIFAFFFQKTNNTGTNTLSWAEQKTKQMFSTFSSVSIGNYLSIRNNGKVKTAKKSSAQLGRSEMWFIQTV